MKCIQKCEPGVPLFCLRSLSKSIGALVILPGKYDRLQANGFGGFNKPGQLKSAIEQPRKKVALKQLSFSRDTHHMHLLLEGICLSHSPMLHTHLLALYFSSWSSFKQPHMLFIRAASISEGQNQHLVWVGARYVGEVAVPFVALQHANFEEVWVLAPSFSRSVSK